MRHPWLIQRCKIKEWSSEKKVSEYLSLDYMGSAEFEFGAIPKCLRAFGEKIKKLKVHAVDSFFILCTDLEVEEYSKHIRAIADDKHRLKEYISLHGLVKGKRERTYSKDDFWFDVDNAVAICLQKEPLENFKLAIVNSINYMNDQQKKNK